ncbi:MAG: hypothetical protein ACLFVL_06870 [Candidatus Aenigmatarchaeota archaeon]
MGSEQKTNLIEKGEKTWTREEIREAHDEINNTLEVLKDLIEVADDLDIHADRDEGKEMILQAVETAEEGYYWKSLAALEESKKFLKNLIDERVEEEITELSQSVKGIKKEIKSRKVDALISKIGDNKVNENYEKVTKLVFEARDIIKKE